MCKPLAFAGWLPVFVAHAQDAIAHEVKRLLYFAWIIGQARRRGLYPT
jgi:hypothetical protein